MLDITGATVLLLDEETELAGGTVRIDGDRVVAVSAGPLPGQESVVLDGDGVPPAEMLDATGCVVTPGLVNAHHHLLQSGFRTLPGTRGVPMAAWLTAMAAAYDTARIDASLLAASAAVGIAEGLLNGVTTVADHMLNWPAMPGEDAAGGRAGVSGAGAHDAYIDETVAIAQAVADATAVLGGRLVFVRGSARDDPAVAAESATAIVETLVPGAVGGVRADGMLQIAVGPAGVHSDSRETFAALGAVAERFGLRRRTQANEQVDTAIALERYGRRPLELLDEWGWLDPAVTIAHLCDVTPGEIDRLAASGVTATHAPGCDLPMGWGIAPVAAMREAGVTVGLGTSGGGSNDAGHLLADARLAMQVAPLVGPALSARQVLGMATRGGAAGLGRQDLGHLAVGAAADLCVWDVSGVADAGVADPVAGLLWASPGRRPRHVVVAGRVVVRDYQLVAVSERALVEALRARVGR